MLFIGLQTTARLVQLINDRLDYEFIVYLFLIESSYMVMLHNLTSPFVKCNDEHQYP